MVSKQLQLTDILISNAPVFLLLSQPAERRGMDSPCAPWKDRLSQATRLTGDTTSLSGARVEKPKSSEGTHQTRVTHASPWVFLRSLGTCSPSPWAEGEGRDGSAMDKAGQGALGVAGGKFAAWEQNA